MKVTSSKFSILITTKNRLTNLAFTLKKISGLVKKDSAACVVFDEGSINIFNTGDKNHIINTIFVINNT